MRNLLILLAFTATATFFSASPSSADDDDDAYAESGTLGVVVSSRRNDTVHRLPNALCKLTPGPSRTTNSDGVCTFEGMKPGMYTLTVTAVQHDSSTQSVQIRDGETTQRSVTLNYTGPGPSGDPDVTE